MIGLGSDKNQSMNIWLAYFYKLLDDEVTIILSLLKKKVPSPHLMLSIQADCPPYSKAQACPVPKVRYQDQVSMASAMLHCGPILLYSQELVQLQSDDLVSMSGRGSRLLGSIEGLARQVFLL